MITIDLAYRQVYVDGAPIPLTATEFRMVTLLADGCAHTHLELVGTTKDIAGLGDDQAAQVTKTFINRARRKGVPAIQTVRGYGYRLDREAGVEVVER